MNGESWILGGLLGISLIGHFWQSWQLATLVRIVLGSQRFLPVGTEKAVDQVARVRDIEISKAQAATSAMDAETYLRVAEDEFMRSKGR